MSDEEKPKEIVQEVEILEILKKDLKGGFQLLSYSVRPASENLSGFLGEHYKISVEVAVRGKNHNCSYFLKRMPTEVPQHREYAVKTGAFYKEVELYKTLFVDLKNAQENPTKWCPRYFYSRGSELFVLEDLTIQGYYMYPEKTYMDEDHAKASLEAVAALHAACFVFEEKYNRGQVGALSPGFERVGGKKVTLGEIYSHLTFETEASDVKGHPGNTYHEAGIGSQLKIVDFLSGYTEEEKLIIKEKLPDVLRRSLQLVKASDRFKNVFLHGDLWANNLLYRKDDTGKVTALIIDFQLARYAPPAADVLMLFHLVLEKKYREKNRLPLLEFYYAAFAKELEKNSLSSEFLLPWNTFLDSCDFYEDLGMICKLFYYQLILAPSEITDEHFSTPELFTKTMLIDRTELVVESFLRNEVCRERVTEAMNDVIKKYILH